MEFLHRVILLGGFDKRLRENVEYLDELKSLAERNGVAGRVNFVTSCSTAERNSLLSECLCVLYTPTVCCLLPFSRIANIDERITIEDFQFDAG